MSTGSFFGDPWDDGDPSRPPSFFGGPLRDALRWQSAGWGNPLLPPAGQPSFPGSLAPPGATFANFRDPLDRAANKGVIQLAGPPGAGDVAPMVSLPVDPIVDDETRKKIESDADDDLKNVGPIVGAAGAAIGLVPYPGLELLGRVIERIGGIIENPFFRRPIAHALGKHVADSIQDDLNRANNASGQQMFLDSGGMPHR